MQHYFCRSLIGLKHFKVQLLGDQVKKEEIPDLPI
jgi:hypothetical protein